MLTGMRVTQCSAGLLTHRAALLYALATPPVPGLVPLTSQIDIQRAEGATTPSQSCCDKVSEAHHMHG